MTRIRSNLDHTKPSFIGEAESSLSPSVDQKPEISRSTSVREKAIVAYPDLAKGLGHRGSFEDLPASAQKAYEQFAQRIITLYKGERE